MDGGIVFVLLLALLAAGVIYVLVRSRVRAWQQECSRLSMQIAKSLDTILSLEDTLLVDQEYIPEQQLKDRGLTATIEGLPDKWEALAQEHEQVRGSAQAIAIGRGLRVVAHPYLMYKTIVRTRQLSNRTSAFETETEQLQRSVAQLRINVHGEIQQRAAQLATQIDRLETVLNQLDTWHVTGSTIGSMIRDLAELRQLADTLVVANPQAIGQTGTEIGRKEIERDLAILDYLEQVARTKLALANQWCAIYETIDRRLRDCDVYLALMEQMLIALPNHLDTEVYMVERHSVQEVYTDARRRQSALEIEHLAPLRDEIAAFNLHLMGVYQRLQQLNDDYNQLHDNIRRLHIHLESIQTAVQALGSALTYPIIWDAIPAQVDALVSAVAEQSTYTHLRTHDQVQQKLAQLQSELNVARSLEDLLIHLTNSRNELIQLLKSAELSQGFAWCEKISGIDQLWRRSGFAAANWGACDAEALLEDARTLASSQRVLVLECVKDIDRLPLSRLYGYELSDTHLLRYDAGLYRLRCLLSIDYLHSSDFLACEHRLRENLNEVQEYGDSENTRVARNRVCGEIDHLVRLWLGLSFDELCAPPLDRIEEQSFQFTEQRLLTMPEEARTLQHAQRALRERAMEIAARLPGLEDAHRQAHRQAEAIKNTCVRLNRTLLPHAFSEQFVDCKERAAVLNEQIEQIIRELNNRGSGLVSQRLEQIQNDLAQVLAQLITDICQAIDAENTLLIGNIQERVTWFDQHTPFLGSSAVIEARNAIASSSAASAASLNFDVDQIDYIQRALGAYIRWQRIDSKIRGESFQPLFEYFQEIMRQKQDAFDKLSQLYNRVTTTTWPPLSANIGGLESQLLTLDSLQVSSSTEVPAIQQDFRQLRGQYDQFIKDIGRVDQQLDIQIDKFLNLYQRLESWKTSTDSSNAILQQPYVEVGPVLDHRKMQVEQLTYELYLSCQQSPRTFEEAHDGLQQILQIATEPVFVPIQDIPAIYAINFLETDKGFTVVPNYIETTNQ